MSIKFQGNSNSTQLQYVLAQGLIDPKASRHSCPSLRCNACCLSVCCKPLHVKSSVSFLTSRNANRHIATQSPLNGNSRLAAVCRHSLALELPSCHCRAEPQSTSTPHKTAPPDVILTTQTQNPNKTQTNQQAHARDDIVCFHFLSLPQHTPASPNTCAFYAYT